MGKFVTFGEILIRLCPPLNQRLAHATSLEIDLTGPEVNTAVSTSNFGHSASIISALSNDQLAQAALNRLHYWNIDTRFVSSRKGRTGLNFLELGVGPRPSTVHHDREHSAFALCDSSDWDWQNTLYRADWFHTSGVTPALSGNAAIATREALKTAHAYNITTSLDLSYRAKLWTPEYARRVLEPILEDVDLLVASTEDIRVIMGIEVPEASDDRLRPPLEGYVEAARKVRERYGISRVVLFIRYTDKQLNHSISAVMLDGKSLVVSRHYPVVIVDRLGTGDAFTGGLISLLMDGGSPGEALEFATAASCLKHSIRGELNKVNKSEVHALMRGASVGQVHR